MKPPFIIFLTLTFSLPLLSAADILPGSSLSAATPNLTVSSPNSTFSLSFLPTASSAVVAAVTYSGGIPVWTTPAADPTATLSLLPSGNLVLVNGSSNATVWSSNTTNRSVSAASVTDSGHLVLVSPAGAIVWSSADHPTDTLLPSQNLSLSQSLSSGPFSFSLLPSGNLTLKWNNSIIYYNLGLNSSLNINLTSPTLALQSIGILQLSDKSLPTAVIMAYSSDYAEGNDVLRFLKLDDDGNLRIYSSARGSGTTTVRWAAVSDQCQVFGYCGNFGVCSYNNTNPVCGCPSQNFEPIDVNDHRKGCRKKVEIENCPGSATMLQLDNTMFLTYAPELASQVFFVGISACRLNCLVSGSCIASTSLSDGTGLCYLKFPNFVSGYSSPALPSTSYVKVCGPVLPNPSLSSLSREERSWGLKGWVVVVVVIVTLFGLAALEGILWWLCCKNNRKFGVLASQYALLEYASGAPVQFSYTELQRATKSFKEKLGEGGFGAVYRGVLANRTIVAVKQLEGIEQGEKQFRMEVATISSTHHLNLVRLIGFCSEGRHRLLVYEYMKNGSLDSFLFSPHQQSGKWLSWEQRFNVALGTARGITYLHEECRDCIVHCDIKPENILLDENYNSKVSDFGLAKLINTKDNRYRTLTSVRGTRGYLAPEWLANLPITSKSDIFSYGMVLLEIVSGKRNFEVSDETNRKKFALWAYEEFEKGNVMGIVDKRLSEQELDMEQVLRAIKVSFWCIQEQPSHRPMMGRVVQMLEGVIDIDTPPAAKAMSEGSSAIGDFSTNVTSNFSVPNSIFAASSSIQTMGISSSVSTRNMERVSSSLLRPETK